jgi:hypothetical protein
MSMAKFLDADLMAECIADDEAQKRGEIDAFEELSRNMARAAIQYERDVASGMPAGSIPGKYVGLAQTAFALAKARGEA